MHRFASFTFANDSNCLTSLDNNTPPMFRSVPRATSKKLDFDNDEDSLSLSNSSPVIMKESLTSLFIKKDSRKTAVSLQGNFPRQVSTLLAFEDESEAGDQRKPENEIRSLLLPRFGSSGDIHMDNKGAEVQDLTPSKANKTISQSLFSQSPQNSQHENQKTFTENQDARAQKSIPNTRSLEDSLAKDFAIKLSLTLNKNSRDPDLNTISPQTTAKLIHETPSSEYLIIDCRYDYEFQGGHIKEAINVLCPKVLEQIFFTNQHLLYNPQYIQDLKKDVSSTLANSESYSNASQESLNKQLPMIIFHCEFSQKRGPRAFRNLRSQDRSANIANFPHLDYPEIYVLEGGYCNFYPQFPELCEGSYVTMIDEEYSMEYAKSRQFEKKCWNKKSYTDLNLLD